MPLNILPFGADALVDLVKLGFLGFGAVIFVMVFWIIWKNDKATGANARLQMRFLTFGFAAFAIAAVVQILPLFMGASMTVTFSPNFDVRQLPRPTIHMADRTLEMDKVYTIQGSQTVKIDVDAAIQKVNTLQQAALDLSKTTTQLARQAVAKANEPTITKAEAVVIEQASENISASVLSGEADRIKKSHEDIRDAIGRISSFKPF
ncbi:MAG: hypothetical protein QM773_09900 [Hyphomonadaceae bacterium]